MLSWAINDCKGPVAIRYPRGGDCGYSESEWPTAVASHRQGNDATLLTYGVMLDRVMGAAELLSKQGVEVSVLRFLSVSPFPVNDLLQQMTGKGPVFVVEEVCNGSGIAENIAYILSQKQIGVRVIGKDLGSNFVTHGALRDLYAHCGLDAKSIAAKIQEVLKNEN